jgi:hypothetical protein
MCVVRLISGTRDLVFLGSHRIEQARRVDAQGFAERAQLIVVRREAADLERGNQHLRHAGSIGQRLLRQAMTETFEFQSQEGAHGSDLLSFR